MPRLPLRYRWDHHHPLHRFLVRNINAGVARIPSGLKYGVAGAVKRRRPPYSLLGPGSVAVQVGAPADTLRTGRSRGLLFSSLTADGGRCVIIEPDPASVAELRAELDRLGHTHTTVVHAGAWNEPSTVELLVDASHPATNVVSGLRDELLDLSRYEKVTVDARPVDDILDELGIGDVDVLSITTNGAERKILEGAATTLGRTEHVALARTEEGYDTVLADLGFDFLHFDDRGQTYRRRPVTSVAPGETG